LSTIRGRKPVVIELVFASVDIDDNILTEVSRLKYMTKLLVVNSGSAIDGEPGSCLCHEVIIALVETQGK
jgi:hypothetical protein